MCTIILVTGTEAFQLKPLFMTHPSRTFFHWIWDLGAWNEMVLTKTATFMISLQFLSTVLNRLHDKKLKVLHVTRHIQCQQGHHTLTDLPSSGIWAMMSGELKIGSKYSHVACTFSHSSMISCVSISLLSHSLKMKQKMLTTSLLLFIRYILAMSFVF